MSHIQVEAVKRAMDYEAQRNAPPPDFPHLPDLHAGRYIDLEFFELERQELFRKTWLFAAHMDEIPEPGSFKLWEMAGQPVVLIHARSGEVNAFYNTCTHRGAPVVREEFGKRRRLLCGYHGWAFDDEGALVGVREPQDFADLDFSCRSLLKIRCERFGRFVFVNFDDNAPPLSDYMGQVAEEMKEFNFDSVRLVKRYVVDLDCNWKIAMEANLEIYHVKSIHPTTVDPLLDSNRNVNSFFPGGHGRMLAPNRVDTLRTAARGGGHAFPLMENINEIARTGIQSYNMIPNWVSPLSNFGFPVLLFWPNGIRKTRFEVWFFGTNWGDDEVSPGWDHYIRNFQSVLEEDTQFGNWIQKSVESYGFRSVPLSYQEARIYYWHQTVDKIIGTDKIKPELQTPPVITDDWIWPNDIIAHVSRSGG